MKNTKKDQVKVLISRPNIRSCTKQGLLFVLAIGFVLIGHGQSLWTGAIDSDWNNLGNWSASPQAKDVVIDPDNYTGNAVSLDFTSNCTTMPKKVTIKNGAIATFDFDFSNINAGQNKVTVTGAGSELIISGGTIDVNSTLKVELGGKVTITGGAVNIDEHFEIIDSGTLVNIAGGTVNVDVDASGKKLKVKRAVLNYTGGTLMVTQNMDINKGGQFNQTGSGCDLDVGGNLIIKNKDNNVNSTFNQDGGDVDIAGLLQLDGKEVGCAPTLDISGGTFDVIGKTDLIGDEGDTCIINVSGGIVTFGDDVRHASAADELEFLDFNLTNGTVFFKGSLIMDHDGGKDDFTQSGTSSITFNNSKTWENRGSFVASSGTVFFDDITTLTDGSDDGVFIFYNLTINSGNTLSQGDVNGASPTDISVRGTWANDGGTFTHRNNEVTMDGTVAQVIDGTSATTFYNLELSNTANVTLDVSAVVANVLSLNGGLLKLRDYDIDIGLGLGTVPYGSISGANSFKYIVTGSGGTLRQNDIGPGRRTGSIDFPVGNSITSYTPVSVNNTGTNADRFDVRICNNVYTGGDCSGTQVTDDAVGKTWHVGEQVPGGSSVELTMQWNGSDELTGFDRTNMEINHFTGGSWKVEGSSGAAVGGGPYNFSGSGITTFSPFALVKTGTVLPIELLTFDAFPLDGDKVELEWVSAMEFNNDFYTIERSIDGKEFELVGTVEASDITSSNSYYALIDYSPYMGKSYYRLTQTDYDGTSETFDIISVEVVEDFDRGVELYPNPSVGGYTKLNIHGFEAGREILVILRDLLGNEHYSKVFVIDNNGHADVAIDLSEKLSVGTYIVTGSSDATMFSRMMIVR